MKSIMALLAGLLFGLGLILSGMTNPAKVIGFLDLAADWDPSLAFVMGGALLIGLLAFPFITKRSKSVLGDAIRLPTATKIDRRLIVGGLIFGVGWGLAGYCPGPAVASLTQGDKPLLFFAAMLAGMALFEVLERMKNRSASRISE